MLLGRLVAYPMNVMIEAALFEAHTVGGKNKPSSFRPSGPFLFDSLSLTLRPMLSLKRLSKTTDLAIGS